MISLAARPFSSSSLYRLMMLSTSEIARVFSLFDCARYLTQSTPGEIGQGDCLAGLVGIFSGAGAGSEDGALGRNGGRSGSFDGSSGFWPDTFFGAESADAGESGTCCPSMGCCSGRVRGAFALSGSTISSPICFAILRRRA